MNKTEKFIEKAKNINGDKYDYSKVEYVSARDKVCILCPNHGEFWQTPDNHISKKQQCPKCKGVEKYTNEIFIEKAKLVHGDKYDYSKVEYVNTKTKVCIICPIHGEFIIEPRHHITGCGCQKCTKKHRPTTEEYIVKSNNVHNNFYSYDKTIYDSVHKKICITCPIHGDFWQEAISHLNGCKCPKCAGGVRFSREEWIDIAINTIGDKYDYSKVEYINAHTKICIICPTHGDFWQTPDAHLRGQGCPKCKSSKLENIINNKLLKNNIKYEYQYTLKELGKQTVDFFIPSLSLVIECQGEQHYHPVNFSNDPSKVDLFDEYYENRKILDEAKYNYCAENKIEMIYFTIPKLFLDKTININTGFYEDKKTFTSVIKIMEYINSKISDGTNMN